MNEEEGSNSGEQTGAMTSQSEVLVTSLILSIAHDEFTESLSTSPLSNAGDDSL